MKKQNDLLPVLLAAVILTVTAVSCGVKGKPLPPLEPAEIGRGAPTYKRAAEQAKPAGVPESSSSTKPVATPERRGP